MLEKISVKAMQAATQKDFGGTHLGSLASFGRQSPPVESSKNVFMACPVHRPCRMFVYLIFSILLLNISCASAPSVTTDGTVSEPVWTAFEDGIDYLHVKTTSPRLEYHALRIDLYSPFIDIIVKGEAVGKRVSSFVRENNLTAGINAAPFDVVSSRENRPIQNMGIVVSGGAMFAPVNPRYDALVFYKDGKAAIVEQSEIHSIENIENAIGGFHKILHGGEPTQRTFNKTGVSAARHPRSATGISSDGKYLYLLVIDGRRAGSIGATEHETAMILLALGSWDAINFDGGGSSALAIRFPDSNVKVVNTPIHNGIPGQERAVAGCLGVRRRPSLSREK